MSVGLPDNIILEILDAMAGGATPLYLAAKVGLFQNDLEPSGTTRLADITPATFSGYALSAAITWAAAGFDTAGRPLVIGDMKTFARGVGAVDNDVYGWYIVDSGGTLLLWARRFPDGPVPMVTPGSILPVLPLLNIIQPEDFGPDGIQ